MAFQRPGVYVQETLNPIQPVAGPAANAVGAFVGANDRGPTTPTLVTSWTQYVSLFGSWNTTSANNDLPIAVYLFFANGGGQAYVTRVLGDSAAKATRTLNDRADTPLPTLTVQSINEGVWGNSINVSITDSTVSGYFNLTVYYKGSTDAYIVERWVDLSLDVADARYVESVINGNSNYISVVDEGSPSIGTNKHPALQANSALSTGADGSLPTSSQMIASLSGFDTISSSLILNLPGIVDATAINGAISYATGDTRLNDVFVVVDGVSGDADSQLSMAATYTASSYAAVYYPQITIADPTAALGAPSNATKTVGAGGAVIGIYAATDASRGVFKAPAGLQARIAGAVSVTPLSNADLDNLNSASAPANAIRYMPGSGIVIMGARTLKAGYVDKYVPVRRSLIYLEKSLSDLTRFAIFEPNDERLWRQISAAVSSFLTGFWSQGGLRGGTPQAAFFVKCDAQNNPQTSIDNGEVHIEVGVALQRPAEFVVIKIGQYDGGTTVTVA